MEQGLIKIERNEKGILVVSSRVVAEQLGKRHDAVLRDLENILKNSTPQICGLFVKSEYKASNGKTNKEYLLTKDGFTLYMFNIQGHNDFKLAYINRFNEMEKALQVKQDSYMIEDPIERAKRWIEEQEESKRLIEDAQRKEKIAVEVKDRVVDAVKNLVESGNGYTIQEVSKVLCFKGLGEIKMFKYLRDIGMLCSDSSSYNQPSITAINSRRMYMDFKSYMKDDEVINYTQTKITKKGVLWLYDRLIKEGYKTIVERDEVEELFI